MKSFRSTQKPKILLFCSGNMNIVKWLVDHNVNVSIYNNSAEIAYDVAKKNGHIDIANYLAEPSGMKLISAEDYVS
jgi:hypothetical protein